MFHLFLRICRGSCFRCVCFLAFLAFQSARASSNPQSFQRGWRTWQLLWKKRIIHHVLTKKMHTWWQLEAFFSPAIVFGGRLLQTCQRCRLARLLGRLWWGFPARCSGVFGLHLREIWHRLDLVQRRVCSVVRGSFLRAWSCCLHCLERRLVKGKLGLPTFVERSSASPSSRGDLILLCVIV